MDESVAKVQVSCGGYTLGMEASFAEYSKKEPEALYELIGTLKESENTTKVVEKVDLSQSGKGLGKAASLAEAIGSATLPSYSADETSTLLPSAVDVTPLAENVIWTTQMTKLLIGQRQERQSSFSKGKNSHKSIWKDIAKSITNVSGINVDWQQCQSKWNKLMSKYKSVEDQNNRSGSDFKTFQFFDEMEQCVGGNPNIRPPVTVSSLENMDETDAKSSCGGGIQVVANEKI